MAMNEPPDRMINEIPGLTRRTTIGVPAAGLGLAAVGAVLAAIPSASAALAAGPSLIPSGGNKLRGLARALAKAPRRRHFKTVPMILTEPDQFDSEALHLLFTYTGGPRQVWDNTKLESPWLNLMRNSMNAQIWSWKHPDFLAISATHGSAHLALYDAYIWNKYLEKFTGGKHNSNSWIETPPAGKASAADFNNPQGVFSPHDNSISVLQRRGAVFCACHNEVWELTMGLLKKGINPDKLSHPEIAAEFTNHLIPDAVLTPGVVGTIPQFELAGYQYIK